MPSPSPPPASGRTERWRQRAALLLWRFSGWPRRTLALALLGCSVLLAVHDASTASAGHRPPQRRILVAAHGLAAGHVLTGSDVRTVRVPPSLAPAGVLGPGQAPVGRSTAGPVRRGEPLTATRFVGPSLARAVGGPGAVAVPARLADAGAARLLHPGDRIDLYASEPGPPVRVRTLARDATVLLVPAADDDGLGGALVLLATDRGTARRIATIPASGRLTATLRAIQ